MATIVKSQSVPNKNINCVVPQSPSGFVVENIDFSYVGTTAATGTELFSGKDVKFIPTYAPTAQATATQAATNAQTALTEISNLPTGGNSSAYYIIAPAMLNQV